MHRRGAYEMPKHWMINISKRMERTREVRYTQHDEVSGVFYNEPEIEPQPWQPLRDKVLQGCIKEREWFASGTFEMMFGFPLDMI